MIAAAERLLTPRQQQILRLLLEHQRQYGAPPTVRQLMAATGINSPNGITCHIDALMCKGLVVRGEKGTSCNIRLVGVRWEPVFHGEAGDLLRMMLGPVVMGDEESEEAG